MRFYFDIANGHKKTDPQGIECATQLDAQRYADKVAAEFQRSDVFKGVRGLSVVVSDVTGYPIYKAAIPE